MKLNNKGFAISSIMYIILVIGVILISLILVTLSSRKLILDKLKNEVLTTIYDSPNITYRQTIKELKNEAIAYMNNNSLEKDSIKIENLESSIDSEVLEKYKLNDKYITAIQNNDSYDVYLGKENTISNTTQLPKNTIDIVDYKIYGNSYQETSVQGKNLFDKNGDFSDSKDYPSGNAYYGHKIQLKPNTNYVASLSQNNRTEYINLTVNNWYGQEGAITYWISHKTNEDASLLEGESLLFTTSDNGIIWINTTNGGTEQAYEKAINECLINFQIEEGANATAYEDFVPNKPSIEYQSEILSVGDYDEVTQNYKISVKTRGKNLFDPNNTYKGYHNGEDEIILSTWGTSTHKIYVDGTSCYLSGNVTPSTISYWDKDGNFIKRIGFSSKKIDITNIGALAFDYYQVNDLSNQNIQLEYDTQTNYEPYIDEKITNIYLDEPLRKINDYEDILSFKDSKISRNINKVVLNGTQSFVTNSTVVKGYQTYHMVINTKNWLALSPLKSNKLQSDKDWNSAYSLKREQVASSDQVVTLRISEDRGIEFTSEGIKSWLKDNPIDILYVLKTKSEQTKELPKINTNIGATQISIDTNILPSNYEFTVIEKIIEI